MSRPILVCFAVKEEAAPFQAERGRPRPLPANVKILVTGMGAAAAERAFKASLAERDWGLVLTCGFAGGLAPAIPPKTVIFDAEPDFPLRQALLDAGAVSASFHCAERVAVTAVEKAALRARTGADAVEMESGIIRRLCRARSLPAATVRVISDAAHEDLPLDFNALMNSEGKLNFAKLAGAVWCRPQKIPALIALGRRSHAAAIRLAAVLRAVLPPP